jgi:hypothetical protein
MMLFNRLQLRHALQGSPAVENSKDQCQVAPVRLFNIAGNAIPVSMQLAALMADQTGLAVCWQFKDPYMPWVSFDFP